MNAIQEALTKHRQEKALIEKRIVGDQQRLQELDAIIAALEAIPSEGETAPAGTQPTTQS